MSFVSGSKVLAYHGPLIYEAKVLQTFEKGKTYVVDQEGKQLPLPDKLKEELRVDSAYLLHYKGWNPKWDEWVESSRVMGVTEETLKLQKELKQKMAKPKQQTLPSAAASGDKKTAKSTAGGSSGGAPSGSAGAGAGSSAGAGRVRSTPPATRKRPHSSTANSSAPSSSSSRSSNSSSASDILLPISPRIKYALVDDWENITKEKILVNIPSTIPVSVILNDYRDFKSRKHTTTRASSAVVDEILSGLEEYFNKSLGLILLYKFERLQYLKTLKRPDLQGLPMSEVYGVEHLLRLFTALPGLIAQTTMDPVSIETLVGESRQILHYIEENLTKYTNGYVNVPPDYENLAQQ